MPPLVVVASTAPVRPSPLTPPLVVDATVAFDTLSSLMPPLVVCGRDLQAGRHLDEVLDLDAAPPECLGALVSSFTPSAVLVSTISTLASNSLAASSEDAFDDPFGADFHIGASGLFDLDLAVDVDDLEPPVAGTWYLRLHSSEARPRPHRG